MSRRLPGARDVRATLDEAEDDSGNGSPSVVVACPPHPQMGGDRHDSRLRAVSEALRARDIDCLRFDYGPWDEGRGEVADARTALAWAGQRYETVGLFGYSFGAGVALLAAGSPNTRDDDGPGGPVAVSVLAPPATIGSREIVAAVDHLAVPLQVIYGSRDTTVDWQPVVERAQRQGQDVVEIAGDHHFVGQTGRVGEYVASFCATHCP